MTESHGWHFASFHLDLRAARLWRGAEAVHLTAKAFGVLRHLVAHAGQLVTKDDLFAAVWATAYVSDAALAVCIRELRQALGDVAHSPQYVETVRGRGYRFIAPMDRKFKRHFSPLLPPLASGPPPSAAPPRPRRLPRPRRPAARRSAARGGLDRPLRRGEAAASAVSRGEGLGTAGSEKPRARHSHCKAKAMEIEK